MSSLERLADSPYRARGALFLGTRSYFESDVPGGFAALTDTLRPALRRFMMQPFAPRAFYEVMDAPELIDAEARVCGLTVPRYLDRRTRHQAQRDLGGITTLMLRVLPPAWFVSRMARVMTDTFNFGLPRVDVLGPDHLQLHITGVPEPLAPWLEHSIGVYGKAGVERAGRRNVEVRPLPADLRIDSGVNLHLDVRWGHASG